MYIPHDLVQLLKVNKKKFLKSAALVGQQRQKFKLCFTISYANI